MTYVEAEAAYVKACHDLIIAAQDRVRDRLRQLSPTATVALLHGEFNEDMLVRVNIDSLNDSDGNMILTPDGWDEAMDELDEPLMYLGELTEDWLGTHSMELA